MENKTEKRPAVLTKAEQRKQHLIRSRSYKAMQKVARYMDQYGLDGIAGLVPGGLGDIVASAFAFVHVYFSLFRLRSIPLTLAVLNNAMRDVLMGMLPFFVGDIIDFFNKSHVKNMKLIEGYVNNDQPIIHELRRKTWQSALILLLLFAAIAAMVWLLMWLTKTLGTAIFS